MWHQPVIIGGENSKRRCSIGESWRWRGGAVEKLGNRIGGKISAAASEIRKQTKSQRAAKAAGGENGSGKKKGENGESGVAGSIGEKSGVEKRRKRGENGAQWREGGKSVERNIGVEEERRCETM
jgi:hypothetical protein